MALIPLEERIEPSSQISNVPGYGGRDRPLAFPVDEIVLDIQSAARDAGFNDPNLFTIFSGYRSDASQESLYQTKVNQILAKNPEMSINEARRLARKTVAPPGNSSHRTGYAFDIYLGHRPGFAIANADPQNTTYIETLPAYGFMQEIASDFGLTQLPNEPWHWECDSECRNRYILRKYNAGLGGGLAVSASMKNSIGRVLLASTILGGAAFAAWWAYTHAQER